jgi:hypothetical protein
MSSLSSNLSTINNRRRSQRVALRIPIAVIAPGPDKQMVREETETLVVNAHGALIYLNLKIVVGQVVILQNPETSEEQPCRVFRSNPAGEGKNEVGIEFLKPTPNFWHVAFPPKDWLPGQPKITSDTF